MCFQATGLAAAAFRSNFRNNDVSISSWERKIRSARSPRSFLITLHKICSGLSGFVKFAVEAANSHSTPIHVKVSTKELNGLKLTIERNRSFPVVDNSFSLVVLVLDAKSAGGSYGISSFVTNNEQGSALKCHPNLSKCLYVARTVDLKGAYIRLHDGLTG